MTRVSAWTRYAAIALVAGMVIAGAGCGGEDSQAAGPHLSGLDSGAEDATVTLDTTGDDDTGAGGSPDTAGQDAGAGDTQTFACNTDLECVADLKVTPCAKPRCVQHVCVMENVSKGTPCQPGGLQPSTCQQTVCNGGGKCVFAPAANGKPCGGSASCGDACVNGICVKGAAQDDGNPCTKTVCEGGTVSHVPINDPSVTCEDAQKCVTKGTCVQGACVGGKKLCDDGVACTIDFCEAGHGCVSLPANGLCDDGNPCTQSACNAKQGCTTGPAKKGTACEDGSACTKNDACDGLGACKPGQNTCGCQSDAECNAGDSDGGGVNKCKPMKCEQQVCKINEKAQVTCDPVDGTCQANVCQPATGTCKVVPVNDKKACDDGDACTLKSACVAGACKGTLPTDCDDKNACTKDACDPKLGACVNVAIPGCGGGCTSDAACSDNDPCTKDSCGSDGKCVNAPIPGCGGGCTSDVACSDNDPCTKDSCGADGKCVNVVIPGCGGGCTSDAACADSNPCTKDSCGADGKCAHVAIAGCKQCKTNSHCNDGDACTKDVCGDIGSNGVGKCTWTSTGDPSCPKCKTAADCDDKNPCTTNTCGTTGVFTGQCLYPAKSCNDKNACTLDTCDKTSGKCVFTKIPNCGGSCTSSAQCADNSKCISSYCSQGSCKSYIKKCDDKNACTTDSCDAATGKCSYKPIAGCALPKCQSKADCDDGNVCTYDQCSKYSGKCYNTKINSCDPTAPKCKVSTDCNDGDACTNDYCSKTTGLCQFYKINNCIIGKSCKTKADCDDKNKCTSNPCVQGKCSSSPITCNDYNPCTNDYCQSYTGKCYHSKKPGCVAEKCSSDKDCDDENTCTLDTCLFGFCQHNKKPGCQ